MRRRSHRPLSTNENLRKYTHTNGCETVRKTHAENESLVRMLMASRSTRTLTYQQLVGVVRLDFAFTFSMCAERRVTKCPCPHNIISIAWIFIAFLTATQSIESNRIESNRIESNRRRQTATRKTVAGSNSQTKSIFKVYKHFFLTICFPFWYSQITESIQRRSRIRSRIKRRTDTAASNRLNTTERSCKKERTRNKRKTKKIGINGM